MARARCSMSAIMVTLPPERCGEVEVRLEEKAGYGGLSPWARSG